MPQNDTIHRSQMQGEFMRYFQKQPPFCKFHGKTPMLELPLNKVAGFQACILIKERLQHRCFPVSIAKFLGTPILKACFHHDMDFGKYKDLVQRTESDKVLKDKAFEIASNPKCKKYE